MKHKRNFLILLLLASLSIISFSSARDLRNADKVQLFEQSSLSSSDSIPTYLINWPLFHGVHSTGEIKASFSCFGVFGFNYSWAAFDYPDSPAVSFVTPPESGIEHLFGGALWIGGIVEGDTLVTTGHGGWHLVTEFFPREFWETPSRGTVSPVEQIANISYRSTFADTAILAVPQDPRDGPHRPLNLKVSNRSFAWHSEPENSTIIYDIVVTNIGDKVIEEGRIGLFMDADVGVPEISYGDDVAGSFRESGVAYIMDNDADSLGPFAQQAPRVFAGKFTANSFVAIDTIFAWWVSNTNSDRDYGPRLLGTTEHPLRDFGTGGTGTPVGDKNKYYVMSFNEWDYDQNLTGTTDSLDSIWTPPPGGIFLRHGDARFLLSIGPFTLKPDSSIRVLFATFTGDSVHVSSTDILANAAISDSLSQLLLDPNLPPLGLQFVPNNQGKPELQWDPWAFDDVLGYDLFIEAAELSQLPKPGAIPPWWEPSISEPSITLAPTHRLNIEDLDPNTIYLAQIVHALSSGRGELSTPIFFKMNPRTAAPQTYTNYALAPAGQPITLKWRSTDKSSIDHFNIYKFADSSGAAGAYHASYDQGYQSQFIPANDSFLVDGKTYYYYAMEPFAVIPASDSEFIDPTVIDGGAYIIASADEFGFESEFTDPIVSYIVPEMNREILLLTKGFRFAMIHYAYLDSILSYYNSLLSGQDYEIYKFSDSIIHPCGPFSIDCVDWRPLMRFKTIIIDDFLNEQMLQTSSKRLDIFSRYLAYGGKIVYFGKFDRLINGMAIIDGQPQYDTYPIDFFGDIFGIKQMFASGPRFYINNSSPPYVDTLFGFTRAQQIAGILPSLNLDTSRDPFTPRLRDIWPMATPPGVATFIPEEGVTSTHQFQSIHPITSIQQDHIVGLRKDWPQFNTQTYTFGFHLWYMDIADARELLEAVLSSSSLLASKTTISKDQYHVVESFTTEPSYASIYMGNIEQEIDVSSINQSSIIVNSSTVPSSVKILSSLPNYDGKVLKLEVPLRNLFGEYSPVWDTITAVYSINTNLEDDRSVRTLGSFTLIGRLRRDLNRDGTVNVVDLTLLVDFLFRNGELPGPLELADVNSDGSVNILDLTGLVDYIFRGIGL